MGAAYLIDGYNLLHAMGLLGGRVGPGGLEKARKRLLDRVAAAFGDKASTVTVVFDASRALSDGNPEQFHRGVHVVFAVGKKEADDVIEELIRHSSAPKSLHVVSDDHRLQTATRRRHGTALSCEKFLQRIERARKPPDPQEPEKKETLSAEEMRLWLEEFGDVEMDPSLKRAFEKFDFE